MIYKGDALEVLGNLPDESFDCVWTDPPYNLSNDGITCVAGKMVPVNKGEWDRSRGIDGDFQFNLAWTAHCFRILKPSGSIWVTGTHHVHPSVGMALLKNGFRILNDIVWLKPNPPPNLGRRTFTHTTEIVYWASKAQKGTAPGHKFNYEQMKLENCGKQMKSVWQFGVPRKGTVETKFGRHPTQKPVALVDRCIRASTDFGDSVLDPFVGSGTTGVAALSVGRSFVGIENKLEFLDTAVARLKEIRSTPPLRKLAESLSPDLLVWTISLQAGLHELSSLPATREGSSMDRFEAIQLLQDLKGQDLRTLAEQFEVTVFSSASGKLNKGWAGQTIERYLGLPINSSRSPNLGSWELKVVPLVRKNGTWVVKETMAITMLDEFEVKHKEFERSHLFQKIGKLITVARHWRGPDESKSEVLLCNAFELTGTDLYDKVYKDYMSIRDALHRNEKLSGKIGHFVQPRTKGAGHGSTSRAFYAKKPLVRHIIGLDQAISLDEDCTIHAGKHNALRRENLDHVMQRLPNNQSGKGRHKCPYCAYEAGFQEGLRAQGHAVAS